LSPRCPSGIQHYAHLREYVTVHMLTYDVLNTFDRELQEYAIRHLRKRQSVQIHLGHSCRRWRRTW